MMRTFIKIVLMIMVFTSSNTNAQITKKTIVEHFTNTKCSVCASRNPGFIANLNLHPQVLNISVHPSSPYATCFLSQQNKIDNDARTNHYGIYGGTPRIVINGNIIPSSTNYSDTALFSSYSGTSPFSISIEQFALAIDSIKSVIVIKRISNGTPTGKAQLFAGLTEDTVFGNGGNGETMHLNVLRRSLYGAGGVAINLPSNIGDSIILNSTEKYNVIWNKNRIRTVALLQDSTSKALIQSEISTTQKTPVITSIQKHGNHAPIAVWPNPTGNTLYLRYENETPLTYQIVNMQGVVTKEGNLTNQTLDLGEQAKGIYFLRVSNGNFIQIIKIVKNQ